MDEKMEEDLKRETIKDLGFRFMELEGARVAYTKQGPEAYAGQRAKWEKGLRDLIGEALTIFNLGELDEVVAKVLEIGSRYAGGESTSFTPSTDRAQ